MAKKADFGKRYAGLTDDPNRRKGEHGNPADWRVTSEFTKEEIARLWEALLLAMDGYVGGPGGQGWRFGYTYTVTDQTIE